MSQEEFQHPIRLLLVEDDEDDYVLVRDALREVAAPIALDWIDDADKALEVLCEERHDVCLLDFRLGSQTGIELLKQARQRECHTPVILLTGLEDGETDRRALEAGANDFLVKSQVTPVLLERAIRYTMQQARVVEAQRRSEVSFRELIERLPDGITVWHQRRLVYANPALIAILGATSTNEFLGLSVLEMDSFIHPEDRETVQIARMEQMDGARSVREVRFLRRSGEIVPVEIAKFFVSFDGQPCVMWIARDLTERKQMHARLMLSDRMASLGTLAAGIGHEVNNPLAYVIANLSHLEQEVLPSLELKEERREELRTLLAETQEGVQRIREIAQQLRLFSQVEREARSTRVDVHQVLETAVRLAWNEIRHRARFARGYTDSLVVEAQEARLGQVFLNLLVNAARAVPEGDVERNEIRVVTRRQDDLAIIEIRDTGVGIPPELRERVFEPFLTMRPGGGTSGLGLSICLGIVTGFNGRMEVESKVGQGSVFRVILPAVAPASSAAQAPALAEQPASRRGRILSVDDEPMIGNAISRALRQEHEVTALTSSREALAQLIRGERYDVILCDLMMPEMSGMDLYEEVVRVAPEQAKRMVFLTGGAFTPKARAFLVGVGNRCMEKPFTPTELRELIRALLGGEQTGT